MLDPDRHKWTTIIGDKIRMGKKIYGKSLLRNGLLSV